MHTDVSLMTWHAAINKRHCASGCAGTATCQVGLLKQNVSSGYLSAAGQQGNKIVVCLNLYV